MSLNTNRTKVNKDIMVPAFTIENGDEQAVTTVDTHTEAVQWITDHPDGAYLIKEIKVWPLYLQAIEMMMLAVDMGRITEDNAEEFYIRVAMWEELFGVNIKGADADNNLVDHPISLDQVRSCIGLTSNVFPMRTRKQYIAKLNKIMSTEAARQIRQTEQRVSRGLVPVS